MTASSLRTLSQAAQRNPADPEGWFRLALALIDNGNTEHAQQSLRQAAAAAVDDLVWLTQVARALAETGAFPDAQMTARRAIQLASEAVEPHLLLADIHRKAGDVDACIVGLRVALARVPDSPHLCLRLAEALQATDRLQEALQVAQRALQLGADPLEAHQLRRRIFFDLGMVDEYVEALVSILQYNPTDFSAATALGQQYALDDRRSEAQAVLLSAIEYVPKDDPTAFLRIGLALLQAHAFEAAERCLAASIRLDPDSADARFAIGRAYERMGRLDAAVGSFRTAAELEPLRADVFQAWGRALRAVGRPREAVTKLRQALANAPHDERLRREVSAMIADLQGRSSAATPPDDAHSGLQHDLSAFSLFDLLDFLVTQRASGVLTAVRQGQEASIVLFDGRIASAAFVGGQGLADLVVQSGLVSRARLETAVDDHRALSDDAFIADLLCNRLPNERDRVYELLVQQARTTLNQLVGWNDGRASFRRRREVRAIPAVSIDTRWLMIEVQRFADEGGPNG